MRPAGPAFTSLRTLHSNLGDGLIVHALIESLLDTNRRVLLQAEGVPDSFIRFVLSGLDESRIELVRTRFWRLALATALGHTARRLRGKERTDGPVLFLTPGHQLLNVGLGAALLKALHTCLLLVLRAFGFRIGRAGFSLEQPTTALAGALERLVGRTCNLYAVRDGFSLQVAQSLGIGHARLAPDLAVLLHSTAQGADSSPTRVAVSFRQLGADELRVPAATASICRGVSRDALDIVALSQTGQDLPTSRRCIELADLEVAEEVELVSCVETVDDLLEHYRHYRLVVSNRLHVILAALAAGTPSVAVVDRRANVKVTAALEAIGLGRLVLTIDVGHAFSESSFDAPGLLADSAGVDGVLTDRAEQLRAMFQEFLTAH